MQQLLSLNSAQCSSTHCLRRQASTSANTAGAFGARRFLGSSFSATLLRSMVVSNDVAAATAAVASAVRRLPLRKVTHPFFIAPLAEYPLLLGFSLAGLLLATVNYFHSGVLGPLAAPSLLAVAFSGFRWAQDMEKLGAVPALHTAVVRSNLVVGVLLFIVSEVMIFFGLFWAYFHSSLNPTAELGAVWPPAGLYVLEWFRWPTLSTALLLYSGATVNTFFYGLKVADSRPALTTPVASAVESFAAPLGAEAAQRSAVLFGVPAASTVATNANAAAAVATNHALARRWRRTAALLTITYGGLVYTVTSGALFLRCQAHEYGHATFSMADGIYGSVFYGLTGLHGLHVAAGLGLLLLTLGRLWAGHMVSSSYPQCSATATVWYWHFVDVVWIFLYAIVYCWGNAGATPLLPTPSPALFPVA